MAIIVAALIAGGLVYKMRRPGTKSGGGAAPRPPVVASGQAPTDAPSYASVESLAADHQRALARVSGAAENLKNIIIRYYTCKALQEEKPAACEKVDPWATPAPPPGQGPQPRCKLLYYEGMALKAALTPDAKNDACLKFVRLNRKDPEEDEPDEELEDCQLFTKYIRLADPAGLCEFEESEADINICRRQFAYLAVDPGKCASAGPEKAACEEKARLLKAIKEDTPALMVSSMYAPLVSKNAAACAPLAREVLARYEKAAAETVKIARNKRQDAEALKTYETRIAEEEDQRKRDVEKAKKEAALKAQLATEEHEKWLAEEEARREREELKRRLQMSEKYEQNRLKDEEKRRKKGKKMRTNTKGVERDSGGIPTGPRKRSK